MCLETRVSARSFPARQAIHPEDWGGGIAILRRLQQYRGVGWGNWPQSDLDTREARLAGRVVPRHHKAHDSRVLASPLRGGWTEEET